MFYDVTEVLSHNCLFNFLVGARGLGKTYSSKKRVIKDNIKNIDNQFIYLRRYKEEFKKNSLFFNDIISNNEFPEHELKVNGLNYLIDGRVCGYGIPLSVSQVLKSVPFDKIKTIIFDEFVIDKGHYRYLPDEVKCFLELYETIARLRDDVRVLFLSNAITFTNPYFLYFNIKMTKSGLYKKGDILMKFVESKEYSDFKKTTRFGKLIKDTPYGNYAIDNKFLRDNDEFIEKKTSNSHYYFGFSFKNEKFGVWVDYQAGKMFVSENVDPCSKLMYAVTIDEHKENTLLIRRANSNMFLKTFIDNYKLGNVYFENMKVKNVSYDIIRLFLM